MEATNLEQYYAAQHRQGPMSWLMIGLALLTTAVIILGLFWGAGWLYKKSKNNDKANTPTTAVKNNGTKTVPIESNGTVNDNPNKQPASSGITTPDTRPATSTDASSTTQTATPPTTPPATNLPNSGPGDLVGVFAGVAAVAGTTHYIATRRQTV